jgi:hypothetical protein
MVIDLFKICTCFDFFKEFKKINASNKVKCTPHQTELMNINLSLFAMSQVELPVLLELSVKYV